MRRALANIMLAALTLAGLGIIAYGASLIDTRIVLVASAVRSEPSIVASDQAVVGSSIIAEHVVAPEDGWVAARTVDARGKAVLNQVVGMAPVAAGETRDLQIPLSDSFHTGDRLLLTLHVDAGSKGVFEFPSAADRAVLSGGAVVASPVRVLGVAAQPDAPAGILGRLSPLLWLALLAGGWLAVRRYLQARPA